MKNKLRNQINLIFEVFEIERKRKNTLTLLLIFMLITLMGSLYFFSDFKDFLNEEYIEFDTPSKALGYEVIDCSNKTLQETVRCLYKIVDKIFVYNVTDDDLDLSFEELKTRGGDCRDWTNFYEENLHLYGFNQTKQTRIFVNEENRDNETIGVYHVFLTAYDSTGYCHLDMTDVFCFTYSNKTE
jgi:hypothetical protein